MYSLKETYSMMAGLLMILSVSCSSGAKEEHDAPEFYDLSNPERVKVSDVLEVADMVPLLFERDTYPKRPTLVSFLDSNIIIEEREDLIHVFSGDGHYIGCSQNKKGQGPGEHSMLTGHIVNPFRHTIDVMTYTKMKSYDPEFVYCKRERDIPTVVGSADKLLYDDGIALSDSRYLMHSSIVTDPYKITLYDASRNEGVKCWSYAGDIIAYFHRSSKKFIRMPDGEILVSGEGYTPYIYGIDKEGKEMYKAIKFKYNDKTITDHVTLDDFRKQPNIWNDYNTITELPLLQFVNSTKIVTVIGTGPDPYADQYIIISDRVNGNSYKIENMDGYRDTVPYLKAIDEDYLYSVYSRQEILENPGYVLNKAGEVDSLLAGIDDEDFVLIKYRFKK